MTTQTQEAPKIEPREIRWSKAQIRRFNELQREVKDAQEAVTRAQEAVQGFIGYLSEEHELDASQPWVVGPQGFVLRPEPPSAPTAGTAATDDGQSPPQEPLQE